MDYGTCSTTPAGLLVVLVLAFVVLALPILRSSHSPVCPVRDLTFAARRADNIIVMANGALKCAGAPGDTIMSGMLVEVHGVGARVERYAQGFLQAIVDRGPAQMRRQSSG